MPSEKLNLELQALDREIRQARVLVAAVMIILLAAYFGWFGLKVQESVSHSSSTWGTLGDFFGGLLNPLIASLALYWLTRSIRIQKEELNETRDALKETATAQAAQVQLAALTALSTTIIAEIDIQRKHIFFILNQMSSLQHGSIRSVEGKALEYVEAQSLILELNSLISIGLTEQRSYEAQIKALLAKASAQETDT